MTQQCTFLWNDVSWRWHSYLMDLNQAASKKKKCFETSIFYIHLWCLFWSEFLWFLLLSPSEEFQMMSVEVNERAPYIQEWQMPSEHPVFTRNPQGWGLFKNSTWKWRVNAASQKKSRWSEVCGLREVHSWACVHGTTWTKPPCKVHDSGPLLLPWVWPVSAPGSVFPLTEADVQHDKIDIAQNLEDVEELRAYQRSWWESCKAPTPCARQWTDTGRNPWSFWTGPGTSDPGSPLGKWPAGRARSPRMSKRAPDQPCGTSQVPSGCFPAGIPHLYWTHFSPKL